MSTRELVVKQLDESDYARWDNFVRQSPDGTFYHLAGWKRLIENELNHETYYLYCEIGGEIASALPLVRVKSWLFGDALISMPFLVYGGPIATNDQALGEVVKAARELAEKLAVDHLELRNQVPLAGDWQIKDTYVTFSQGLGSGSRSEPDGNSTETTCHGSQRDQGWIEGRT